MKTFVKTRGGRSWHLLNTVQTYCGRYPGAYERHDLPLGEKSCETCLRLSAAETARITRYAYGDLISDGNQQRAVTPQWLDTLRIGQTFWVGPYGLQVVELTPNDEETAVIGVVDL